MSGAARIDETRARRAFEAALAQHSQAFGTFFLARFLGLQISYAENRCRVEFETADFMFNPQGSLHGGVIATAMDISMGHLLNHLQGPGITLELKTQFVRAVRGGRVRAVGQAIRRGAGISFMQSSFFDADGELAAFATSTWKSLPAASGGSEQR